jgi:hypothetical protein
MKRQSLLLRSLTTCLALLVAVGCADAPASSVSARPAQAQDHTHHHGAHDRHEASADRSAPPPGLTVSADPAARVLQLRLGPMALPAGGEHAMVRTPLLTAEVPVGGWLIGFKATLRNEAGDVLPGHLLHHVNIMVPDRADVFRPIMQRLMAAGEETEAIDLPWPLGIPVPEGRELLVYAMLHNPHDVDHGHVWLDMSIRYTERRRWAVHPFFIDVSPPPGPASWDLPPGRSERSWEGTPAVAGRILGVGGHLHRFGTELVLEDVTAGRVVTRLRPDIGPDGSIRRVEIRRFLWRLGVPLRTDRVYRITAVYENPTPDTIPGGAMGAIGGAVLPRGRAWPTPDPSNPLFIRDLDGLINFDAHIH